MLLEICIPTFNRHEYLINNLEILYDELKIYDLFGIINITVRDNNTDQSNIFEIKNICYNFGFRHIVNNTNIGSDLNIYNSYTSSKSKYVLVLGDDDYLLPGQLNFIKDYLLKQNPDILLIKPCGYDVDYISEVPHLKNSTSLTSDIKHYIYQAGSLPTFISSIIVKSKFSKLIKEEEVIGTNLIQLAIFLRAIKMGSKFSKFSHYSLSCKRNNTSGYNIEDVFVFKLNELLMRLNIPDDLKLTIFNTYIVKFYPQIFYLRRVNGKISTFNIKKIKSIVYNNNILYYIFLSPILNYPRPIMIPYGLSIVLISRIINGDMNRVIYFFYTKFLRIIN